MSASVLTPGVSVGDQVDLEVRLGASLRLYCPCCLRFAAGAGNDAVTCRCGASYARQPGESVYRVVRVP